MSEQAFHVKKFHVSSIPTPTPPIDMLRQAGNALAQSTDGQVEGIIFTANPGGSNQFRHTFYLRARALNDYTYPLFYVWHGVSLYPANVLRADDKQEKDTIICRSEAALHDTIQQILDERTTENLVEALLAQIRNAV